METRSSYVIVGTFVLLMVAALFAFVVFIAKVQFDETNVPYHVYFDGSVTGLQKGSAVRFRGVAVGVVSDIRIAPDDASKVRVTLDISASTPITQDAVATIEMQGITGIAYIQIFGGAKGSPSLEPGGRGQIPVIPSRPSQISEVFDAAPQLLNNLVSLSERAGAFLTPENAERVTAILANTEKATASLDSALGDLKQITPAARDAATALSTVAQQAAGILTENREPIHDFTTTGLYDMALLMAEFRELVGHLSRISAQVERDPSGFLLAGPRAGVTPQEAPAPRTPESAAR